MHFPQKENVSFLNPLFYTQQPNNTKALSDKGSK